MDDAAPPSGPRPRVPPVEPDLLGSAIFLFGEYLQKIVDETPAGGEDEEESDFDEEEVSPIDMREVLDLFAEELATSVPITLNLYMRVTALFRLLAGSPSLARLAAADDEAAGGLSEDALLAAARLDLHVTRSGEGGVADFDAREFRVALTND